MARMRYESSEPLPEADEADDSGESAEAESGDGEAGGSVEAGDAAEPVDADEAGGVDEPDESEDADEEDEVTERSSGMVTITVVPLPLLEAISTVPSNWRARSRIPCSPIPGVAMRELSACEENIPLPSSQTSRRISPSSRDRRTLAVGLSECR